MTIENKVYTDQHYWRRIKAFVRVFVLVGVISLGGLCAVLYAFHEDPDVELEQVEHTRCVHCQGQPHLRASYASGEIIGSGIVFVLVLSAGAVFSAVVTSDQTHPHRMF